MRSYRTAFSIAFLVLVSTACICLVPSVFCRDVLRSAARKGSVASTVAERIQRGMPLSSFFVRLNGGASRVAGRRICNKRMRYGNGMLGRPYPPERAGKDMKACPEYRDMAGLAHDLERLGVPFLFALAPCKIDDKMELFPEGWVGGNPNAAARDFLACMAEAGVDTLDFTRRFAITPEAVTESFYRTDHHWNIRSAFAAAASIAEELSVRLGGRGGAESPDARMGNWEWRTVPGGFLGSHGRRTGVLFSGLDDFEYAVPTFATEMERIQPSAGIRLAGDFSRVEIAAKSLKPAAVQSRYLVYCGSDVGYQIHRNSMSTMPHRIVVVKDSFGKPVVSFLAAVFREVVEVDCRYLPKDETVLSIVTRHRPDAVVRVANPSTLHLGVGGVEER